MPSKADQLASILGDILRDEAVKFVEKNSSEFIDLGEETIEAIINGELIDEIVLPAISGEPDTQTLVDHERILLKRDTYAALIAKAELEHRVKAKQLRDKAIGVALKVSGLIAGSSVKALLGVIK